MSEVTQLETIARMELEAVVKNSRNKFFKTLKEDKKLASRAARLRKKMEYAIFSNISLEKIFQADICDLKNFRPVLLNFSSINFSAVLIYRLLTETLNMIIASQLLFWKQKNQHQIKFG